MPKLYLKQFFESLVAQTYTEWDLVIVNDGYEELETLLRNYEQLNTVVIKGQNNIVKNRMIAIKYACSNGYENIIFGDADDYFSSNRIAHSIALLRENDIVVNDLSSVDSDGYLIVDNLFSNRLNDNQIIQREFIHEKNIFGLSNTAVKTKLFDNIVFDESVVALDWFLFSQLLSNHDTNAVFTTATQTYYRQHEMNTAGIKRKVTSESIKKEIRVKRLHYKALANIDSSYNKIKVKAEELEQELENDPAKCKQYCDTINRKGLEPVFWWESTTL